MFYITNDKKITKKRTADSSLILFKDKEFLNFDWKTEPSEHINELYRLRAQELRDQYDHIILAYSGGQDSHQVFNAFHQNGIKIDEIHTFYPLGLRKFAEQNAAHNAMGLLLEYDHAVVPRFSSNEFKGYKTFVHDVTEFIVGNFKSDKFLQDEREVLNTTQLYYVLIEGAANRILNAHIERGGHQRTAVIYGIDRVLLGRSGPDFYVFFNDFVFWRNEMHNDAKHNLFEPVRFFMDDAKIMAKQAHLLFNVVKKNPRAFDGIDLMAFRNTDYCRKLFYPTSFDGIWQQKLKCLDDDKMFQMIYETSPLDDILRATMPLRSPLIIPSGRSVITSRHYPIGSLPTNG